MDEGGGGGVGGGKEGQVVLRSWEEQRRWNGYKNKQLRIKGWRIKSGGGGEKTARGVEVL